MSEQYCYMEYYNEKDYYNTYIEKRTPAQYSEQYLKFKQHIIAIGALDLTDHKNQKTIPYKYWRTAIVSNCHIFPIDVHYIKNVLYRDKVFNLMSPMLEKMLK